MDVKGLFEVNFISELKSNDEIIFGEKLSDKIVILLRFEIVILINKIMKEIGVMIFIVEK